VDPGDESVVTIDLTGRMAPRIIGLAWHRDRLPSPAAQAFIETAATVCGELSADAAARSPELQPAAARPAAARPAAAGNA
jgi:hypothetical protein